MVLIGCNGCRSGKVINSITSGSKKINSDQSDSIVSLNHNDSIPMGRSVTFTEEEKRNRYPHYNEKRRITYLDENTIEFQGIKRETKGPETKIIFSNGKILSNFKDAAIWKDIPKRAQLYDYSNEGEEYFKEVDIKKLSQAQRVEWFGKMKLHPDIQQADLDYMILHSYFIEPDETPDRVCLATYATIWTEYGELAGRIAQIDIYDDEGKLILQIPMYEYGGRGFTVTKDQKYLLANSNGYSLGDNGFNCGKINPMINIYSFADGNVIEQIKMPCGTFAFGGTDSYFTFSMDGSLYTGIVNVTNRLIKTIKNNQEILDGPTSRTDEGYVTKDGKLWKYQTYTFDQWNQMDLSIFEDNSNK